MRYIDNFSYQLYGHQSNKKLVFLHGLMGSAQNWRRIVDGFANNFEVLTYDQRGHGRSFKPANGYAPEDYAEDLFNILKDLGWEKLVLVGHSMGGRNAMVFAAQHPEQVEKLVVEDIGPHASESARGRIRRLLDLIPTPFTTKAEAKSYIFGEFLRQIPEERHPHTLAQFFYMNLVETMDKVDWRFNRSGVLQSVEEGRNRDRSPLLKQIQCPTLFVRGEHSDEFSEKEYADVLASNPLFRGVEIKEAGHWVHFEKPEAFVEALKAFINDKPSS